MSSRAQCAASVVCERRQAAIKCSADRAQLDTVSYTLPIGVGRERWSVQPSRQCYARPGRGVARIRSARRDNRTGPGGPY
jgi:hypothetical protein